MMWFPSTPQHPIIRCIQGRTLYVTQGTKDTMRARRKSHSMHRLPATRIRACSPNQNPRVNCPNGNNLRKRTWKMRRWGAFLLTQVATSKSAASVTSRLHQAAVPMLCHACKPKSGRPQLPTHYSWGCAATSAGPTLEAQPFSAARFR